MILALHLRYFEICFEVASIDDCGLALTCTIISFQLHGRMILTSEQEISFIF
jgi:hypothetical protein